jgi:hypothetical protein
MEKYYSGILKIFGQHKIGTEEPGGDFLPFGEPLSGVSLILVTGV